MKKLNVSKWVMLFALMAATACAPKQQEEASSAAAAEEWAALDAFHVFMADMYHPYKDSANLAPLKAQAAEFAAEAGKWTAAPLPEKVDSEEVKQMLEKLKADTEALAALVQQGASDEHIGASLTAVHDHFHAIQEAWYGGSGHGHHHGHDH